MKHKSALIIFFSTILIAISVFGANRSSKFTKKVVQEHVTNNANVTEAMLNGKPAFFKTYEDFISGKGSPWEYQYEDVKFSKGEITSCTYVFKTESGKKIKISPSELWGWRNGYGEVYRIGDFHFQGVTKAAFNIFYVANDHVYYKPKQIGSFYINPPVWCSADLNSPIIDKDIYFKSHDKESYYRIQMTETPCANKIPFKQSFNTNIKGLSDYNKKISECKLNSKDLVCIFTITSWNGMRTQGIGSYLFNKTISK